MHLSWNVDTAIFAAFLTFNLAVGLFYSKGIKSIRQYAIGNRNFSTATIVATLVATWISGGSFSLYLSETYNQGLYFIVCILADAGSFLIIAYIFAPRMKEFLGQLSVAEAMGNLYGNLVRVITAATGFIGTIGALAVQFKACESILSYCFSIPSIYSVLLSGAVVILYSTLGGIKAVTFTDIIQLFTFGTCIPILALIIWETLDDPSSVIKTITENPLLDYHQVFDPKTLRFWQALALFIYFLIPGLSPATFQRITMAKNVEQIRRSFVISAVILLIIELLISWIAVLVLSRDPDLGSNSLISYIIDHYSYVGLKGFIIAGIMAMIMSTSDSYINSSAILFTNDFCRPLGLRLSEKKELFLARIFSVLIGLTAIIFTYFATSILNLFLLGYSFYMIIVTVPFILAILGFRSSKKAVLIGMVAGMVVVLIWSYLDQPNIDNIIPGMLANLVFYVGSHYFLKQPGGWIGVKDPSPIIALRLERKRKFKRIINSIKQFSLINFCKSNLPRNEDTFTLFGFLVMATTYFSLYTIPEITRIHYKKIYDFIYHSILIISTGFLTYPIWSSTFRNEKFIAIAWNLGIFYLLICVGSMLVIISDFDQLQLMIFMLNLLVTGILLRWQIALLITIFGTFASLQFFKCCMGEYYLTGNFGKIQFQIIYLLLLFSSACIAFLKPKQKHEELSEIMKNVWETKSRKLTHDLIKATQHQEEFFNRIEYQEQQQLHTLRLQLEALCTKLQNTANEDQISRITAVTPVDNSLETSIGKDFSDKRLRKLNFASSSKSGLQNIAGIAGITEELHEVAKRIKSWASYLSTITHRVRHQVHIKLTEINIKNLIDEVVGECEKLSDQPLQFIVRSKQKYHNITCDLEKIKSVIKSLLIHVINNNVDGNIVSIFLEDDILDFELNISETTKSKKPIKAIKLIIQDQGGTLTERQLQLLLTPTFKQTNELTFLECFNVIDAHYGNLKVHSNRDQGINYNITIPVNIKEIRPKVMDLPDIRIENLKKIAEIFLQEQKDDRLNIAQKFFQAGVDLDIIEQITLIKKEEITNIKN